MNASFVFKCTTKITFRQKKSVLGHILKATFTTILLAFLTADAAAGVKSQLHDSIKPHTTMTEHLALLNAVLSNPLDLIKELKANEIIDNRSPENIKNHAAEEAVYVLFKGRAGAHKNTAWGLSPLIAITENSNNLQVMVSTLQKAYDILKKHKIKNIIDLLNLLFPHHEQLYYRLESNDKNIVTPYLDEHLQNPEGYRKHIATLVLILMLHEERTNNIKLEKSLETLKKSEFSDIAKLLQDKNSLLITDMRFKLSDHNQPSIDIEELEEDGFEDDGVVESDGYFEE